MDPLGRSIAGLVAGGTFIRTPPGGAELGQYSQPRSTQGLRWRGSRGVGWQLHCRSARTAVAPRPMAVGSQDAGWRQPLPSMEPPELRAAMNAEVPLPQSTHQARKPIQLSPLSSHFTALPSGCSGKVTLTTGDKRTASSARLDGGFLAVKLEN